MPRRNTPPSQTKRWCITVFDPVWEPAVDASIIEYLCWGRERAPETGNIHTHVYVRFTTRRRMGSVKVAIGRLEAHCEGAIDSEQGCRDYCWCEGSHTDKLPLHIAKGSVGLFDPTAGAEAGNRSDMEEVTQMIKDGATDAEIAERFGPQFIRYHRGIQALREAVAARPPIARDVEVIVLWGPTGTGKTHRVMTNFGDSIAIVATGAHPWDSYTNQTTLFFDEFDPERFKVFEMNKILDKWRFDLGARYHNRSAAWTRVVICANSNPGSWYQDCAPLVIDAFRRRIRGRCWYVPDQAMDLPTLLATSPTAL